MARTELLYRAVSAVYIQFFPKRRVFFPFFGNAVKLSGGLRVRGRRGEARMCGKGGTAPRERLGHALEGRGSFLNA